MSAELTGSSAGGGAELRFTTEEVASLASDIEQHASEYRRRWADVPDISAAACGQGFAAQGARLQAAAARLRDHGQAMYEGLGSHGPAIRQQWRQFEASDVDAAAGLAGITGIAGIEVAD